jgi:hypothetical protein
MRQNQLLLRLLVAAHRQRSVALQAPAAAAAAGAALEVAADSAERCSSQMLCRSQALCSLALAAHVLVQQGGVHMPAGHRHMLRAWAACCPTNPAECIWYVWCAALKCVALQA